MIDLRLPNITATTEREQLLQIKSYLNQLIPELQFAMSNVSAPAVTTVAPTAKVVSTAPSNADAQATFNSIKSLIIKSAEIVDAYYDEIEKKLNGEYFADSDFGSFIENTTASIVANSTSITQNYDSHQQLITDIQTDVYDIINNAYVKTGEIGKDADGNPIIGVEIRQKTERDGVETYDKCAQFTSGKLSFYENDVKVAWLSGYKLCVTNAEIENSMTLGGFVFEKDRGLALKWVGKE